MKKWLKHSPEFLLIGLCIFALSYKIGLMPLSADEPIRSLIALDMEYNGNFVTPEIDGDTYLKKPPLYNWILLGFFKVFQSHEEWVIRLPSILSILLFGAIISLLSWRHSRDLNQAIVTGMAWVTGGHLLLYSSYLGHIDVTYSLTTFLGIYSLFYFGERKDFLSMFLVSYVLAACGFLMKGLPSIVFQAISLFTYLIVFQSWKKLFDWRNFLGIAFFILPIGIYLFFFSRHADLTSYFNTLWTESSSRTISNKSFLQSVEHLLVFPFKFILDLFPWSLGLLVFFNRKIRQKILEDRFYKFCLIMFGANIIIYWLSPDYRARYVFMLMPFVLFPSIDLMRKAIYPKIISRIAQVLLILALLASWLYRLSRGGNEEYLSLFLLSALVFVIFIYLNIHKRTWYLLIVVLLTVRLLNSEVLLPERIASSPYQLEKKQSIEIAKITKGEDLAMYHSNVNLTMSWYLSIYRKEIPHTERYEFDKSSFYLVPQDVLLDAENSTTYYTFVRRYLNKPFALVKFKKYFPEMPKNE